MFITFEGIDRSGKTTQASLLAEALGQRTVLVREPGGTQAGERLRELVADPRLTLGARAELMLFCAARAELVAEVIGPAIGAGRDVVCDRYFDSTAAYQGAAIGALHADAPEFEGRTTRDIGFELIERLNPLVVGGCIPELTILIRIDPELAAARGQQRIEAGAADGSDRFEARGIEFQREIAAAYEELARRHSERIVAVEGEGDPADVHARVVELVEGRR